jgi:hypothetical protein
MFWLRYFEIFFRAGVAVIIKALGDERLASHIANTAWYKHEILRMDIRTDRMRRRKNLTDKIAEIDAMTTESLSPMVRQALLRVRKLAVGFIADIDRRNAEEDI